MRIALNNIGNLSRADVEINGITVIGGENNTGKSTVSKALYSVFNSFFHINEQIASERANSIENKIRRLDRTIRKRRYYGSNIEKKLADEIVKGLEIYANDEIRLKNLIKDYLINSKGGTETFSEDDNDAIQEIVSDIQNVLSIPDDEIFSLVLEKRLDGEFNHQINNIFSESNGSISLKIGDSEMDVFIKDNEVTAVNNNIDLRTEAVYIDDPYILEEPYYSYMHGDHRAYLASRLTHVSQGENIIDEIIADKRLNTIYAKISSVCRGEIIESSSFEIGYKVSNTDKVLDVHNLSMGLKTFAIIKTLLERGMIEQDGVLILDEPEIHLHPEWQLLFAELIVMLQKEFSLHILLNTHSPYFLRAIQVYAARYHVIERCGFYLAEEENGLAVINDVTYNVERIYAKLAEPFQILENREWEDD